jgi:hypothetical protein
LTCSTVVVSSIHSLVSDKLDTLRPLALANE